MDNTATQKIKDILSQNENIAIVVGKDSGFDEMAAALSLYLSLKNSGKNVSIACPTDPIVEISSLVGINKVKNSISTEDGDLIVSFPYKEGEIEKVSYTLDEGYLNIVVKAGNSGLSFNEKDIAYKRGGNPPSVLFVVGTPRISDLGNLFDTEALKNTTVINLDNKAENQGFGEIVLVSSGYSSVSEITANLLDSLGLEMDIDISQNLLSGISYATNNFQSQKTSSLAFEMTALLLKNGALRTKVNPVSESFSGVPKPLQQNRNPQQYPENRDFGVRQQQNRPFQKRPVIQQVQQQSPFRKPMQQQSQPSQQGGYSPFGKVNPKPEEAKKDEAPDDWLSPKIYKGSTNIE
ncbi:MAG: hypothetical protein Q7R53_03130 [bacterium]|nr:hypothetical protein [bacterium]